MTIPPNFVPTNNQSIDLTTGIVTEKETGIQMSIDEYAQAMVDAGKAHNVNEARVEMGLPQLANLPPAPDGDGKPSFTVPAPQPVVAPAVAVPADHPASKAAVVASSLHVAEHLIVAAGPEVVPFLPAKWQLFAQLALALIGATEGKATSPASLGQP